MEVVAGVLDAVAWLIEQAHSPGGIAGIVIGDPPLVVSAFVQPEFLVVDQVGGEFADVYHPGGAGVVEACAG